MGGSPAWGLGVGLTTTHRKNIFVTKSYKGPRTWRNAYRILVGKPEEKRPLGRAKRIWEDNIKKNGREI
jgi:hypothetical protein